MKNTIPALLFSFIFGLTLFPGCGKNPYLDKIAEVDSLLIEIDNISAELDRVDSAKIYSRLRKQIYTINYLQRNMDTMSRETSFLIDRYAQYKKAYSKWGEKIPAFYEEADLRKSQLTDLKNDMVKELIEEQKANLYFSQENLYINTLKEVVHRMDSSLNSIDTSYLRTDSQVMEVMKRLEDKPEL